MGLTTGLPGWLHPVARAARNRHQALVDVARPRGHLLLSGAAKPEQFTAWAATCLRSLGTRFGDHRDWTVIDRWATGIAAELHKPRSETPTHTAPSGY